MYKRIDVHHHHAGAQHAEQRDRILQKVRHHQARRGRRATSPDFFCSQAANARLKLVELRVGQGRAHVADTRAGCRRRRRPPRTSPAARGTASGSMSVGTPGGYCLSQIRSTGRLLIFCPACIAPVQDASNVGASTEYAWRMHRMRSSARDPDRTHGLASLVSGMPGALRAAFIGYGACLFMQPVKHTLTGTRAFSLLSDAGRHRQCAGADARSDRLHLFARRKASCASRPTNCSSSASRSFRRTSSRIPT